MRWIFPNRFLVGHLVSGYLLNYASTIAHLHNEIRQVQRCSTLCYLEPILYDLLYALTLPPITRKVISRIKVTTVDATVFLMPRQMCYGWSCILLRLLAGDDNVVAPFVCFPSSLDDSLLLSSKGSFLTDRGLQKVYKIVEPGSERIMVRKYHPYTKVFLYAQQVGPGNSW